MAGLSLRTYLSRFAEVCSAKFGRNYDFRLLEDRMVSVRKGERPLSTQDVARIFDPVQTPFLRYWPKPNEDELDRALKKEPLYLASVADTRDLLQPLLTVFHNTGVASLVLRFVHPDRFGIFSTPLLNLLQIHRPSTLELYLGFCEELQVWKEHFLMPSVAETEMALWTYDQLARGLARTDEMSNLRREFEGDHWIQRRRVAQVLRPFLKTYGPLELARILLDEDPNLAGKVAAEEYERLLRCASLRFYRQPLGNKRGAAETLIERLATDGHISVEEKIKLHQIWKVRCDAVHPETRPSAAGVDVMIDRLEEICLRWEPPPHK